MAYDFLPKVTFFPRIFCLGKMFSFIHFLAAEALAKARPRNRNFRRGTSRRCAHGQHEWEQPSKALCHTSQAGKQPSHRMYLRGHLKLLILIGMANWYHASTAHSQIVRSPLHRPRVYPQYGSNSSVALAEIGGQNCGAWNVSPTGAFTPSSVVVPRLPPDDVAPVCGGRRLLEAT